MIDSILLRQKAVPSERALRKFTRQGKRAFYRVGDGSSYSPTLFHFVAPDGVQYISAEASLPKFIFGDNVQMLATGADLNRALHAVGEFASEHFGVAFDARTANVGRVDFCYNFSVGEELIFSYLQAASEAEPAHLKRRIIGKIETVEFSNKRRKIYFYDKRLETENLLKRGKAVAETLESARGILRFETRFSTTEAVQHLATEQLNLPDFTAQSLLNFDVAKKVLTSALESLCLNEPVVSIDNRINKLKDFYGYGSRLQRLAGFLWLCDVYGHKKLVKLGIMKPSAYFKQRKEVRDASAFLFSSYHSTLPPLLIM